MHLYSLLAEIIEVSEKKPYNNHQYEYRIFFFCIDVIFSLLFFFYEFTSSVELDSRINFKLHSSCVSKVKMGMYVYFYYKKYYH